MCVGPFHEIQDKANPLIFSYSLSSRSKELSHSISFISQVITFVIIWQLKALSFFETYFGFKYPFKSYKQVFVDETYSEFAAYSSLGILSSNFLLDPSIIDQTYDTCFWVSFALALQWIGSFISVKNWFIRLNISISTPNRGDLWIPYGIAGYVSSLFYRQMFGNNEYILKIIEVE